MSLTNSNFIKKVRRLPKEKRTFLLDVMEHAYFEYQKIKPIRRQLKKYKLFATFARNWTLSFQSVPVAMWMLLDDSKKRNTEEMKLRLREMERLVMHHHFRDMYSAITAQIEGTIFDETHIASGEAIPSEKRREYEVYTKDYIKANNDMRRYFASQIMLPRQQRKGYQLPHLDRQRD